MDADVEPEPCRDCMTPIPPGWGWCADCEQRHKYADAVSVLRAIAHYDWKTLLERVEGGCIIHRGDTYADPEDFDLAGDFEEDARYIRPARDALINEAACDVLDDIDRMGTS